MTGQDNNTNEAFLRFVQVKKTYDHQCSTKRLTTRRISAYPLQQSQQSGAL
ncbi:hypothetical protein [Ventosimonas gracilis]|uniref:hypothetical protein n=1 Tax=Ventosimonas gracilis TaxID=1680762 RepID=UPI0013651CE7|nr:hypothetical protein [Ventosimonas gracilis]